MSLYRFFVKVSKRSDFPDPNEPLSASISLATIKEASDISFKPRIKVRALPAVHACNLPQQAYEIKKYENLF